MVIDEQDAFRVFRELEQMPEDLRPRAASMLADYRTQQEREGLPLWPTQEKAKIERKSKIAEIFGDPLKLDAEDGSYVQADRVSPGLGDKLRKREANVLFLADRYGADEADVRNRLDFYKADASEKWGGVVLDDGAFFAKAKGEVDQDAQKIETVRSAADSAVMSALKGGDGFSDFAAWQVENEANPAAFDEAAKAWNQTRESVLKKLGPDGMAAAKRGVRALRNLTGAGAESDAWFNQARSELIAIKAADPAKYQLVLSAMQAMGQTEAAGDKSVLQGVGEKLGRGVEALAAGAAESTQIASARLAGMGVTNADDPKALEASIRAGIDVDGDLRDLVNGVIDPVETSKAGYIERGLYMAAGSLPYMAAAMVPGGQAVMAGSFTADSYRDFRRAGWEGADAETAAVLSGVFQSKVERASEVLLKVPGVASVMAKFGVKPGSNWAGQFLIRSAARSGTEALEEIVQEATTPFIQELAARVSESVPDRPEGQKLKDVMAEFMKADNLAPLLISVIPLGMIGAGMTTSADMRTLQDTVRLFGEKEAALIMAETDVAKRDAMIRERFNAMSSKDMVKAAAAASAADVDQTAAVNAALQRAEELALIPKLRRDSQGWAVEDSETGAVVRVSNREEAVSRVFGHLDEQEQRRAQAGAELWDEVYQGGAEALKAEAGDMTTTRLAQRSAGDAEWVRRGVETYAQLHGLTPEEASQAVGGVMGFNREETIEGVRSAVSSVFGRGMNVGTVLHEATHGRWKAGLDSGRFTHAQGVAWVRMAEQATGLDFLPSKVDTDISPEVLDEAIVDVTVSDAIGRRKAGGKFSAGLISRGMASMARGERNAALGRDKKERADSREAGKFATWLKSWRDFWGVVINKGKALKKARDEGKLGDDFDALLDELLDVSPQARHEAMSSQEALEIVDSGNAPFSLGYLGNVQDSGNVQLKAVDLARGTHESEGLDQGSEGMGTFRYRKDNETIYWHLPPGDLRKESAASALERKGFNVKRQVVMVYGSESALLAHGLDRELANAPFSLAPSNPDKFKAWFKDSKVTDAQGKPLVVYHGAPDVRGLFSDGFKKFSRGSVFFAAADYQPANTYADPRRAFDFQNAEEGVIPLYLSIQNPMEIDANGARWRETERFVQEAKDDGFDGIIIRNVLDDYNTTAATRPTTVYAFFSPTQAKSALTESMRSRLDRQPIAGAVPNSGEFSPNDPRLSFSLAPRSLAETADTVLASQMRKPEFKQAFLTEARKRLDKIRTDGAWRVDKRGVASRRVGFDTKMAGVRSASNIENERKFRLRSRQRELIDAGLATMTPETMLAYDQGVASLEDHPLISSMLNDHGKLMSKTTALRLGKLKTDGKGNAGDYDDAPRLPISWYAKTDGIMPDVMATTNLGFDSVNRFWDALRSVIYSTRTQNEAFAKARDVVKDIEAKALAQARSESDAWAKAETAKIPTEKERQMMALRTLDAILSAFPPEIRGRVGGFVKLASLGSDKAREAEIERRLEKLDEVVEKAAQKHYREIIKSTFERYAAKREAGKKPVGQLDPDAQELVDAARDAMKLDDLGTTAEVARIDALLADPNISTERETFLQRQRELVQLFGDFDSRSEATGKLNKNGDPIYRTVHDGADAARLEAAAEALQFTASEGWAKWKIRKLMEKERRDISRAALIADTGKPSNGKNRDAMNKWASTTFGKAFSGLLNISSFGELLRFEFGDKSAVARQLEDGERKAAYQYEDAMQAFGDRVGDFFEQLAGGRLAGEQLRFDLAQPTLTVGTGDNERTISPMQGIQALLMWQQEDGRRHMEGSTDENGKPDGAWHYGDAWIADLESKLPPEAYEVKRFLEQLYSEEYTPLNALYRSRHGVSLPKNERYSPITVQPIQAKAGEMVDPVSGFAVTGSILTPGALRARNKTAIAEPRFDDAVQIFLGHSRQMEHWKAYYDFATEAQAILLNRDVTNAVEAKGSTQAVTILKKWVDQFAQGGSRDAQAGLAISSAYQRISGRAARVALLGRISTLLIQSTQLAAASVKMPVGAYLKRLGLLLSGNLDYSGAVQSPFIQRRYKAAPPIVQQALAGLGTTNRPGAMSSTTPRILGNALSGADALFTGGTYAMILDYHRTVTGPAMGLQGAELEAFARGEAERDTEAVAQPTRAGTRSIFENTLTSPLAKTGFAFASEARQKIALAAWSAYNAKKDPAQAAKVAILTFVVGGLGSQILKNLWREAKGDDDEKMWSPERLAKSLIAGPLHGVPGISELMGDPGLFSGLSWSAKGVQNIAEKALSGDIDEVTMRDVENLMSAAGYFNDTAAGVSALSHAGFDFAKILDNLVSE